VEEKRGWPVGRFVKRAGPIFEQNGLRRGRFNFLLPTPPIPTTHFGEGERARGRKMSDLRRSGYVIGVMFIAAHAAHQMVFGALTLVFISNNHTLSLTDACHPFFYGLNKVGQSLGMSGIAQLLGLVNLLLRCDKWMIQLVLGFVVNLILLGFLFALVVRGEDQCVNPRLKNFYENIHVMFWIEWMYTVFFVGFYYMYVSFKLRGGDEDGK